MGVDRQDITVHAASFEHWGGPVFYASVPCSTDIFKGRRASGSGVRHRLVSLLWDHLVEMGSPHWIERPSSHSAAFPIQIVRGPLGRPHLLLGEHRGPAVSFSEGRGSLWAALCGDRSDIGIDVAGADEFQKGYPFHRVFREREIQHALELTGGEWGSASALLWSIKEAVVKALGCGFHLVDPVQINIDPSVVVGAEEGGYTFPVRLSRKALMRFPSGADRTLWVRSLPQEKAWLSITFLNWRS